MTDDTTDTDSSTDTEQGVFHRIEEGDSYVTSGRTVSEADIMNFAGVSGDFNHIHTDKERMADSNFGSRIAHGMFVLSAATGLVWQHRTTEEREAVVAFYGIDELRFRNPTFIGDTIRVRMEVLETQERPEGPGNGTVRYGMEVKNQRDETVLSCEMISLLE
ncbi:MAG: MaoC/PaaZ C-terminal domain-containing protein [Natronomonas sp.]